MFSWAKRAVVSIPLVALLALTACGEQRTSSSSTASIESASAAVTSRRGDTDVDFVKRMIRHHEMGIAMSRMAERRAGRDAVRELASRIATVQSLEVVLMRSWLRGWGEPAPRPHRMAGMPGRGAYVGMGSGHVDRMFLVMMIAHHEDAIVQAEAEMARGQDEKVLDLAARIVADQTAEIAVMEQLLADGSGR